MAESVVQRTFAAGELAPALHARADHEKYLSGLRTCRNFFVMRHGGVANRPGLRFVHECKTANPAVRLVRYVSEVAGESVLIEAGPNYLRFYRSGAIVRVEGVAAWDSGTDYVQGDLVESGGVNYYAREDSTNEAPPNATYWYPLEDDILEVPTPFAVPRQFQWAQSGRVITVTGFGVAPQELHYLALTRWVLVPIATAPQISAPANPQVTLGGAGTRVYAYVVTAAAADSYEESNPSAQVIAGSAAEPTTDDPHVVSWDAVTGAAEYYVYCDPYENGVYGFIGTTVGTDFRDVGFEPDFATTPPIAQSPFAATSSRPSVVGWYKQRRFFAHTEAEPETIFGSRVGFPSNFGISSPLQDDDAIRFRIAGNQHHPVRHLVGLRRGLVALTDGGAWTIAGAGGSVLTPSSIDADQDTYVGAAPVTPVVVGNSIIYVQARGTIPRDLRFERDTDGFAGRDLSMFSAHLFDRRRTIVAMDHAETPHSIVWCVRSDGALLGLTYLREHDVWGWHRHDTGAAGRFEDVCVIPEENEDGVYVIVRRTIGGEFVRYIERFASREIEEFDRDAFFVDSGLSYAGEPENQIGGLDHLEGEVVAVVGDGAVVYNGAATGSQAEQFRVTNGAITLPASYSNIHAGLPMQAEIETLDLDVQGTAIRDRKKRVVGLTLLVDRSSRVFMAGMNAQQLRPYRVPTTVTTEDEFTGQCEIALVSAFTDHGRVLIRQVDPLPLTILGLVPNVDMGG